VSARARSVKRPIGDYVFISIAIAVTSLWVLVGLFPSVWVALTAFKSSWETVIFPPTVFPKMPQRITVTIAYDSGTAPAAPADLLSLARDDAFTAEWALYDNNPRQPIGEVQVQSYLDGRLVYQSSLYAWIYNYARNRVWATTLLNRRQILRHKAEILDGDTPAPFYEKKFMVYEPGKGPPIPPAGFSDAKIATDSRETLATLGMVGTVHAVKVASAPERFFDNFVTAWNNARKATGPLKWGRYFINSGIISVGYILSQWLFSACAAFALSRLLTRRASKYVTMFFLATMMIPPVAMVLPLYLQMQSLRLLNTFWGIILPSIPTAFFIYIFKGFFNELPGDLFDAARVDGASEYWVFGRVAIPLARSVFAVVTLMSFLNSWNGGGGLMWSSLVLRNEMMWPFPLAMYWLTAGHQGVEQASVQPGFMALILIAAIPTLIMFAFFQNRVAKGLVWAGIKG
jgi:ABC-type glycerol-3-phosphate transport system permease component